LVSFFKEDEQGERVLVYCDLPFAEDRRELVFRSLIDRKHMPTEDQVGSATDPVQICVRIDPCHFSIIMTKEKNQVLAEIITEVLWRIVL
jgi:hypothetical protein